MDSFSFIFVNYYVQVSFIFTATKFSKSCISCDDKIQPKKEITKNQWVHKYGVEDSEGSP